MKISKNIFLCNLLIFSITIVTFVLVLLANNTWDNIQRVNRENAIIQGLASELRISSQQLTENVRLYATTSNASFKDIYQSIIDVRAGKKSRPSSTSIAPNEKISLLELLKRHGVNDAEYALVEQANALSNILIRLEIEAMNAIEGKFKDKTGAYTIDGPPDSTKAINLVFDFSYRVEIAKIMAPLNEFASLIDARTKKSIVELGTSLELRSTLVAIGTFIILFATIISYLIVYRRVVIPLSETTEFAEKVAAGDLDRQIKVFKLDEIGILRQTLNAFVHNLREKIQELEEKTTESHKTAEEALVAKEEALIAMQMAKDATKIKSQFLASMSHEIRTPINSILGLSGLLCSSTIEEVNMQHAKNIYQSSSLLLQIINDLLDISKFEAGKIELIPVHYLLTPQISEVSMIVHSLAQSKSLTYQYTLHDDAELCLYGDDIRLRQILLNLLSNAIKFTEKGLVSLDVLVKENTLQFVIKDSGIGIKKDEIEKVFQSFHQTDKSKNRNVQGTGLGLTICRNLATLMEGTIAVESEYGKGSTFTLTIPKILGDKELITKEKIQRPFTTENVHVLIVDDMDINLYVAKALLTSYKINCTTAKSGAESLECLKNGNKKFDFVFMDYYMPEMNGLEASLAIRELGGQFVSLPIVALTANAMPEDKARCKKATMNDFLSKPIERDKLYTILERWIPEEKRIYENNS